MIRAAMVRNNARFLAPVALAAVAVGIYLIVHANVATTHTTTMHTTSDTVRRTHTARHRPAAPRFYTVRSGDTLSAIAAKTKVPLSELTGLNPSLSPPYSLHTGQRLRLRR